MKRWQKILLGLAAILVVLLAAAWVTYHGGVHEAPGVVHQQPVPAHVIQERHAASGATAQILFGDLHVHTTFSADAFLRSIPLLNGDGAHPPADACDFARFCSNLDFFALTDHAESITPRHWQESLDSVRQCNAVAGDRENPDLVAFAGFEWSQVGRTAAEHYGHKNVIFHGTAPDEVPTRPIAAPGISSRTMEHGTSISPLTLLSVPILDFPRRQRYLDLALFAREIKDVRACPEGVDVHDLPVDCHEVARTPQVLFEKLAQWDLDSLVIPHGTSWGFYTPPGYTYAKQISPRQDDPSRQRLIEVYSGHGNSEQYRSWRAQETAADGTAVCAAPSKNYEPCCWRAGEIIRSRCGDAPAPVCEARVIAARKNYLRVGVAGHLTVPGATVEDWKNCGQCTDCFVPTFNYRPGGSAQYILAHGNFDHPGSPYRMELGFIGSSDNHTARPGTGYKDYARHKMTETAGPRSAAWRERMFGAPVAPAPESLALTPDEILQRMPYTVVNLERQASFFMTGGLVAVHADGRDRDSIWKALRARNVYGTSGDRILLWFDLLDSAADTVPMGADVTLHGAPHFSVRALGAFKQKPGCPDWTQRELSPARLARLCAGECFNPSDHRHRITRIEVVRIRPQISKDEAIDQLVEDPWRSFDCPTGTDECALEFDDPQFAASGRDAYYYVRAIEQTSKAINAGGLRCEGKDCQTMRPCYGDFRTAYQENCMADIEERAWSSPIFVHYQPASPAHDPQVAGQQVKHPSAAMLTP